MSDICHCLCKHRHPNELGLCAETGDAVMVLGHGRTVPACAPCLDAAARHVDRTPTMPDPWGPTLAPEDDIPERPIREVLSRLASAGGQLSEYAAAAIVGRPVSTESARALDSIRRLVDAADEALFAWDRWATVDLAPERVETFEIVGPITVTSSAPPPAEKTWPMVQLKASAPPARRRELTPDQQEAAARHQALQNGEQA